MNDKDRLLREIEELKFQLEQRETDLETYRNELVKTNSELERLITMVTSQLDVAGRIQKLLTPTEYPNISGLEFSSKFVPGTRHGGDYFDIFEHEDKMRFGMILVSCSGYSMSALLLSILLKFTGQLKARRSKNVVESVTSIFNDLLKEMSEKDSVSMFYSCVDRRNYELDYVYMGDLSCMVMQAGTGKIHKLCHHGPPLHKGDEPKVVSDIFSLSPKDRLVFCSQGVADARAADNEKFGEERIFKAVLRAPKKSVHDVRNEVLFQLEKFRGSTAYDRDVTVLAAEVKDRVIKLAKK